MFRSVQSACDARGERWWRSHADWLLAMTEIQRGDPAEAERHALEALPVKRDFADVAGTAMCLEMLATVALATGDPRRTALLHGASERIYRSFSKPQLGSPFFAAMHDDAEKTARTLIGDGAYERAEAAWLRLDGDEAIARALKTEPGPATPGRP